MQYRYKLLYVVNSVDFISDEESSEIHVYTDWLETWMPLTSIHSYNVKIYNAFEVEALKDNPDVEKFNFKFDTTKLISGKSITIDEGYTIMLVREDCVWFNLDVVCIGVEDLIPDLTDLFMVATNNIRYM